MDITIFTFELGSLQSHHLPSIIWRWEITFSWASYSVNLTKPNPLEFPVFASRFTWDKNKHPVLTINCHHMQPRAMCIFLLLLMLYLNHDDFSKCAKVIFQVLLRCFPGQTQYDQVRCLHVPSLHFHSRGCINFFHFPFVVYNEINTDQLYLNLTDSRGNFDYHYFDFVNNWQNQSCTGEKLNLLFMSNKIINICHCSCYFCTKKVCKHLSINL